MFIAVEGCGVVIVPALRVAEDATVNALKNALLLAIEHHASPLVASVAGSRLFSGHGLVLLRLVVRWPTMRSQQQACRQHRLCSWGSHTSMRRTITRFNAAYTDARTPTSVNESATTRSTQVALRPQEFRRALGAAQTSWGTRTPAAMALTIAENCSAALLHKQREQRAKEGFLIVAGSPAIPWYYPSTYITYRRVSIG